MFFKEGETFFRKFDMFDGRNLNKHTSANMIKICFYSFYRPFNFSTVYYASHHKLSVELIFWHENHIFVTINCFMAHKIV